MALMVQGMETALQRTGQEVAGSGGVDKNHPDLVAYWTFDEGRGYVVHDASGHSHDLFLTNEPQWQVGHSTLAGHLTDPGCRSADGPPLAGLSRRPRLSEHDCMSGVQHAAT